MHRRTATIGTVSTLVTALAAVLVGATPAQAAPAQSAVTTQARAAGTIHDLFTSEVQHTSVAKTGGRSGSGWSSTWTSGRWWRTCGSTNARVAGHIRAGAGSGQAGVVVSGLALVDLDRVRQRGQAGPRRLLRGSRRHHLPRRRHLQGQVTGRAFVHRHYYPGYLTSQFPALYPRSKTIHDSTMLENRRPYPTRATMRVRNRSGKVVFTRAGKALRTYTRVTWDGRDARGRALPAGNYYAKVSGVDRDGLRGSTEAQKVVVSAKRLRAQRPGRVTVSPSASHHRSTTTR